MVVRAPTLLLKRDLEQQIALAEAGETEEFDPRAFEPDAFR